MVVVLSFVQNVFEWVVSAVVIVRVFRGVARDRWHFDRRAVVVDGELKIWVASLRPGTVLALDVKHLPKKPYQNIKNILQHYFQIIRVLIFHKFCHIG